MLLIPRRSGERFYFIYLIKTKHNKAGAVSCVVNLEVSLPGPRAEKLSWSSSPGVREFLNLLGVSSSTGFSLSFFPLPPSLPSILDICVLTSQVDVVLFQTFVGHVQVFN